MNIFLLSTNTFFIFFCSFFLLGLTCIFIHLLLLLSHFIKKQTTGCSRWLFSQLIFSFWLSQSEKRNTYEKRNGSSRWFESVRTSNDRNCLITSTVDLALACYTYCSNYSHSSHILCIYKQWFINWFEYYIENLSKKNLLLYIHLFTYIRILIWYPSKNLLIIDNHRTISLYSRWL